MKSPYSLSETSHVPRGSLPWRTPFSSTTHLAPSGPGLLTSSHERTDQPFGSPLSGKRGFAVALVWEAAFAAPAFVASSAPPAIPTRQAMAEHKATVIRTRAGIGIPSL